jgi:hypothetical protein
MRDDQLFGLVALLALLLWLVARMVPGPQQRLFERLAFWLIGGGIAVAVFLTVLHFLG